MLAIRVLSIIALCGSIAWMVFVPGFEPLVTLMGSLSTLITTMFLGGEKKEKHHTTTVTNKLYGNPNLDLKEVSSHRDTNTDD